MDEQRLDKWLWCARFYKTRSLAADAIKAGRVDVNEQRAKPAKMIHIADTVAIKQPPYLHVVEIRGLAAQRGPAVFAQTLYAETDASRTARAQVKANIELNASGEERRPGKPSKKERRERVQLKRELSG